MTTYMDHISRAKITVNCPGDGMNFRTSLGLKYYEPKIL